jgi:type 1 fimbria pilin
MTQRPTVLALSIIAKINFTADYYRMSDNSAEVSAGHVKAMLEVVIQEE